jgi:transcriptional regulator with XRE-family HTH domain
MAAESDAVAERTLGQLLRAYRLAAGLTQGILAARAGVGEQTIGYLERELVRRPQQATVERLAVALGLSEEEREHLERARRRQPPRLGQRAGRPGRPPSPAAADRRAAPIVNLFVPPAGAVLGASPAQLVTLTGPGRETTAVALAAHNLFHAWGYTNVFFVSLAGITAARLPGAILAAITPEAAEVSSAEMLLGDLRAQHLLLIIDRCEHLIDPCAALIDAILRHCPAVRVLATCTEPLHVEGEIVRRIAPLA